MMLEPLPTAKPLQFRLRDTFVGMTSAAVMAAVLGPYLRSVDAPLGSKLFVALVCVLAGAAWAPTWIYLSRIGAGQPLMEVPCQRRQAWRAALYDLFVSPVWGVVGVAPLGLDSGLVVPAAVLYVASHTLMASLLVSWYWRAYTHVQFTTNGLIRDADTFVSWDEIELPSTPPFGSIYPITVNLTFRRGTIALVNSPGLAEQVQAVFDQHATLYRVNPIEAEPATTSETEEQSR